MQDKKYLKLSILIIILSALLRFGFAAYHEVSGDACWHLASARFIANEKIIPLNEGLGRLEPFWPPPAFHLIGAFIYSVFGGGSFAEFMLKMVSPLMGTLLIIVSFLIIKKFTGTKTLFYSAIFLCFIPIMMDFTTLSYVDSTAAFFAVLSMYLLFEKRLILASLSFAISLLSKYNIFFMVPLMIYLVYKTSGKLKLKRNSTYLSISIIISSLWLLRNWIYFHNPVWPFMNGIFNGLNIGVAFNQINIGNIFSFSPYLAFYLELFGVPNGNIASLSFIPSNIKPIFALWIIATAMFLYPILLGIKKTKSNILSKSSLFAFVPFLVMLLIYLVTTGWFSPRLLMPIAPFIALIWGEGLSRIRHKYFSALILLIPLAFVLSFGIKLYIAKALWEPYQQDFQWVKGNTQSNEVLFGNGQCVPYKTERLMMYSTHAKGMEEADYVWVNEKWNVDFKPEKVFLDKISSAKNIDLVYNNPTSGTKVYRIKRVQVS